MAKECPQCGGSGRVQLSDVLPDTKDYGFQTECDMCKGWGSLTCPIVIIAGHRDFNNYKFVKEKCDFILQNTPEFVVISGGAKGVDELALEYARERDVPRKVYPADWKKHGKAAGPMRNKVMASKGTHLIAFWDQKSKGTSNMINEAKKRSLKIKIVRLDLVDEKYWMKKSY